MAFGTSKRAAQIPNATASTFSLARILGHETYDTDPLSKTADTLKAYQGWIYSCVSTISGDVRRSPWNIWQKAGASREEWKPLDDAQLPAVLLRPNASQTWGDLIELTQVHLDLAGKAFWHIITRPGSNKAIGLQALNPDWIDEPIFDSTKTRHIGWRVNVPGAQRREIAAEDVLFFRYPDPVDPFGGMSPLRAVAMAHDMDTYARAYGASHLRNHAQPTGILTTEAELTRDQAGAIAENWKDTHLGTESIQVLGKGAQYQPLSASIRDLEFLTLARVSRDQILAAYHIPASRLGLVEDSSRANGDESERVYSSLCLGPRLQRYEEPITMNLLPRLGLDPARYAFEFKPVDVSDKEFKRVASSEAFGRGAITLNEYRDSIGFGPDANGKGDVYFIPMGSIVSDEPESGFAPLAASQSLPTSSEPVNEEPKENAAKQGEAGIGESVAPETVLNGAQVTSLIQVVTAMLSGLLPYASALEIIQSAFGMSTEKAKRILGPESNAGSIRPEEAPAEIERALKEIGQDKEIVDSAALRFLSGHDKNERRMRGKIRALFSKEGKKLAASAKDGTLRIIHFNDLELRAVGDDVFDSVEADWLGVIEEETFASIKSGFDLLPGDLSQPAGIGVRFDLVDKRATAYAKEHAADVVSFIRGESQSQMRTLVTEAVDEGWSTSKLAKAISERYNRFKGARSKMVARTEVGNAMNYGKHEHAVEVQKEFGIILSKTWLSTVGDERTREWHKPENIRPSVTIGIDDSFVVNGEEMKRPHDENGSGDNVINCRCVLTYESD